MFILGLVGIIIITKFSPSMDDLREGNINSKRSENFSGFISEMRIEKQNHNRAFIILQSGDKINIENALFEKLRIGDSVVKTKDQLILKVIREEEQMSFEY